ncbi:MAG: acyl carrier protein [Spirochaetales bacterium]
MTKQMQKQLAEDLGLEIDKVTDETRIVEDLGYDSLDTVEMLMNLEEKYNIAIPDDEAINLKTLGDVAKYLENVK